MSVAEAPAAVPLRERANPAPQAPASLTPNDGIGLFLRTILEHHQELGLDAGQIAELSSLYWSASLPAAAGAIEAIERTLSLEQFRNGIAYFVSASSSDKEATPPEAADISGLVKTAVDERTKDKDVIAVDLAAKAADRLMSWMKMFGFCVALPVAGFLALLSLMGISSFQDLQNVKTRAEATLHSLTDASKQVDGQLAELRNHLNANARQIEALGSRVHSLEEKLSFGAAVDLSSSQRIKLDKAAADFRRYFQTLGYVPNTESINISTKVGVPGGLSYYDPDSNSIVIKAKVADDKTLLFHEYVHRILYTSLSFDALGGDPEWKWSARPIEYGLAAYFVASFGKQPLVGALAARLLGPAARAWKLPLDLENTQRITSTQLGDTMPDDALIGQLELAWGGAFWEMRRKLGQNITDKSLYEAWRALTDQDQALVAHTFVANIATQFQSLAGKPAVKVLREILARRGLSGTDLPTAE